MDLLQGAQYNRAFAPRPLSYYPVSMDRRSVFIVIGNTPILNPGQARVMKVERTRDLKFPEEV